MGTAPTQLADGNSISVAVKPLDDGNFVIDTLAVRAVWLMLALILACASALTGRRPFLHRAHAPVCCSAGPDELPSTYTATKNGLKVLDVAQSSSGGASAAMGEVVKIRFSGALLSGA